MKLQVPFVQLPLCFDAAALAAEILALGESCWKPHPQGFAGNSMLPLIAVGGDADNEGFAGAMGPTPHLDRCPYLRQVLASLGATLGRTRLMRLSGHAEVTLHADQGYYWVERVRVHVPIITQPTVRFFCGDAEVNMAPGECWIFDTWRLHRVLNDDQHSRVHLVVDTIGGEEFWELTSHGRIHTAPKSAGQWNPQLIKPTDGVKPELFFEAVNVPLVMTPWEINSHIAFLIAESEPHPQLQTVQLLAARFCRRWQSLWARYGDHVEGREKFRNAIEAFFALCLQHGDKIRLRNGLQFIGALKMMIGTSSVTLKPEQTPAGKLDFAAMGDRA